MNFYFKTFLSALVIFLSTAVNGQFNYKIGTIITLDNDTLSGFINDGGEIRNSVVCMFKPNRKAKVEKYLPGEIKAFRFTGERYHQSNKIEFKDKSKYVFTEVLIKGDISLYYYWKNKEMTYYIEREQGSLIGLLNKEVNVPITESMIQNRNHAYNIYDLYQYQNNMLYFDIDIYKDTLFSFFSDAKNIQSQLLNVKYNKKALLNISKAYIGESCKGKDCLVYERDLKLSKPSFGVFSGVQFSNISFWETYSTAFETVSESDIKTDFVPSVPIGIFYNLPVPRISENLAFQLELISNRIVYNQGSIRLPGNESIKLNLNTVSVPLLVKYKFFSRKVSPSLAFGRILNFVYDSDVFNPNMLNEGEIAKLIVHKNQTGNWFYEAGLNYKIARNLSVFSNFRFQSNYNLIVSSDPRESDKNAVSFTNVLENNMFVNRFKSNTFSVHVGLTF